MLVATVNEIPVKTHQVLGLVMGTCESSSRAWDFKEKHGTKEIHGVKDRMIDEAEKLGADALLDVRFVLPYTESSLSSKVNEKVLAYGTAVKFQTA